MKRTKRMIVKTKRVVMHKKRVTRRTKLIRFQLKKRGDFDLHMKNDKPPIKYFQKLTPIVFKHG
jgi:hypothetical protein